jgi:hypothetical protein
MKITYPTNGFVSIWAGKFLSEEKFDQHIDEYITPALGLKIPLDRICELSFEEVDLPIGKLLEGFSQYKTFIDEAERKSILLGVQSANSVLVCYSLCCIEVSEKWGEMFFIGSIQQIIEPN